jgi:hypothetical protein
MPNKSAREIPQPSHEPFHSALRRPKPDPATLRILLRLRTGRHFHVSAFAGVRLTGDGRSPGPTRIREQSSTSAVRE